MRSLVLTGLALCVCTWTLAQQPSSETGPDQNQRPSSVRNRDKEAGESSSRDTKIDLSPPKDDDKNHPESAAAVADADPGASDVQEFHAWDPHKAIKDIEIGDYYLRRKNYRAALDRYQEALQFKPNDAIANFRSAECYAKLKDSEKARASYEQYLKILPHGPLAEEAQKALAKLAKNQSSPNPSQTNQ